MPRVCGKALQLHPWHLRSGASSFFATLGLILIVFCSLSAWPQLSSAQNPQTKKVLVLHSYLRGFLWNDAIDGAVESILRKDNPGLQIETEYMDHKRLNESAYVKQFYNICRQRFGNLRFDVVICSDNNSLGFWKEYRDEIFPETPFVFCGINNFQKSMLKGKNLFAGTIEEIEIRETLDIALKLRPKARHVFVYGSDTTTYSTNKEILEKIIPDYQNSVDFTLANDFNIRQAQNNIQKLPNNSLILVLSSIKDEQGQLLLFQRFPEMMAGVCNVPIFGCWDFLLGHGIVGGKLTGGFTQGQTSARLALRILNGEKVETIPLVKEDRNQYMFDYKQMQRFGIMMSQLPVGSIVINKPLSLYSKYWPYVWGVLASITFLTLIIVIFGIIIYNRKKAEEALRESEERFRTLAEDAPFGITIMKPDKSFEYINSMFTEIFGYTIEDIPDNDIFLRKAYPDEKYRGEVISTWKEGLVKNSKQREIKTRVFKVRCKDKRDRIIRFRPVILKNGKEFITYEDISFQVSTGEEKKRLQTRLQQIQKMEAIGTLAGGIAHKFNNALSSITGNIELIKMDFSDDEEISQYADAMEYSAYQMADLTSQLLAYARGGKYNPKVISLSDFLEDTLPLIRHNINRAVQIKTDL
ncbi:MAG TPA: hypothetical protein DDW42_05930, partial [Desulfobacteraceae bacterium]|nr:hypothetical protein [Desulfobacteraceae bacterium]